MNVAVFNTDFLEADTCIFCYVVPNPVVRETVLYYLVKNILVLDVHLLSVFGSRVLEFVSFIFILDLISFQCVVSCVHNTNMNIEILQFDLFENHRNCINFHHKLFHFFANFKFEHFV